jgi:hypothetical protein
MKPNPTPEGDRKMKSKLIGLIHWWLQLAPVRHQHWCPVNEDRCYHSSVCWYCEGVFCIGQDKKKCAGCVTGNPCKHKTGIPQLCPCKYHT